ncbi:MAG: site-2 protease family protein [Oscillospiraceae bacterium]
MGSVTMQRIISLLVRALVLFTAFPVHESAHALSAHWMGDDTAKNQGRISLNPFKHINLFGALFMLFAGVGAANPVPIDARNFKKPKAGMALSSLAGPLSNLLLAYLSMIIYRILFIVYYEKFSTNFSAPSDVMIILLYIFQYAALLNIGLAVFNLLPIPPLDGSRILTLFLPEEKYFGIMKYEKYIFGILFVLIISGILNKPLAFLQNLATDALFSLTGWVDYIIYVFLR